MHLEGSEVESTWVIVVIVVLLVIIIRVIIVIIVIFVIIEIMVIMVIMIISVILVLNKLVPNISETLTSEVATASQCCRCQCGLLRR